MVTRRRLVAALGMTLATPVRVLAQQTTARRIGFLSLDTSSSEAGQQALEKFPAALTKLGYAVGRDVIVEWRWADGMSASLPRLAESLVRDRVDVIVARTNGPIRAAREATRTIPVVMLNGTLPVETGLVRSLPHPGGNVTGTAYVSPDTLAKQLQLLKEFVPQARRVAALLPADPARSVTPAADGSYMFETVGQRASLSRAAELLGMTVRFFEVGRPEDVTPVLARLAASAPDAVWYSGAPVLRTRTDEIMALLVKRKLPSIAAIPGFAEQGGLVHYAPEIDEFYERTAEYVDRILKGARPGDLPVQQPTRYELVVNLKTAKAIGIVVPPSMLARANRVIDD